jgi:predicted  nucleic acid-binding Zn-ribbon protein
LILPAVGLFYLPSAARSQETARKSVSQTNDGNAVLTSRGLTRVGNVYLLGDEIAAKDAIKEGEDALKQMEAVGQTRRQTLAQTQERVASIDEELSTAKQERNNLNSQKQRLRDQYAGFQDANSQTFLRNQMQQIDDQIREKQDSIDRLNPSLTQAQTQLQTQQASLRELESEYQSKLAAHERRFQHVKAQYQPIMKDREVIQALKQLNRTARPWVMIGPNWEYDKNVRSLAQLVLSEAGLELSQTTVVKRVGRKSAKVKVPRLTLAKQEKDVRAAGYQAWNWATKVNGPDGATNREKLSAAVPPLKKRIAEVQKAYTVLNRDPLITSAIEHVAPGAKLEPTDEFKTSAKRLPDLEKALITKG